MRSPLTQRHMTKKEKPALDKFDWYEIAKTFIDDVSSARRCAYCNDEIFDQEEISTFCGDIHRDCLANHLNECAICGADEGLAALDEEN